MIIAAVVFALLLGAFIFLVLPRAGFARRTVSVGIFLMLIAIVYGGSVELLSRPKPLRFEWRDPARTQVLSAVPVENQAIYLWLAIPGSLEPRAYVMPWSQAAAQQLQDAMNKAEAEGTAIEMAMSLEPGLDDREPMFYAKPQPPLPPKDYETGTRPITYEQPRPAPQ
jgi:hypothetical protein